MNILEQLNGLVETALETTTVDMTETSKGGGGSTILENGTYYGHFLEYIELGKQLPTKDGKPTGKPAVLTVKVAFKLYSPTGEVAYIRPYPMAYSNGEKANFKKLFDRLNLKGDIKHMAQKLGQAFKFEVTKETSRQGKEYNKINLETITGLPKFDPETGEAVKLPELDTSELRLFLWSNPTQETWDALYIDGTNDKGKSKNFIQEDILKAVDYEGSPLQALLEGGVPNLEAPAPEAPSAPQAPGAPQAPTAPVAPMAPPAPAE
ncbi:hypothetical protein PM75_009 [Proteus phage PM 75]|uniref:Uncharacterized protein n=1 Tax=Proteus phage PM 75 TaxID=1560282 RepID=A0A0F6NY84_9CAUD|nr:hypothetical protein ACQ40_gp09 [Proteus phage PM 75]AIW03092.1 hypothetical protein PM75_009 [Proteus phage PM 75]